MSSGVVLKQIFRGLEIIYPIRKEEITKDWSERNKRVIDSGGLHIIGTERHESRRIDNQLRGRSGRQGDPGSAVFICRLKIT